MLTNDIIHNKYLEFNVIFQVISELENDIKNHKIVDWKLSRENDGYHAYIKTFTPPDHIKFHLDCSIKDC